MLLDCSVLNLEESYAESYLPIQVWVQGGYEAEYLTEAKYQQAVQQDPTISHAFLRLGQHVIKMKMEDPNCKFRLERVAAAIKEKVKVSKLSQQGLAEPEMHFVTLDCYTKEFGSPDPSEIVYEIIKGQSVPGVNVLTGRDGWFKRVNVDLNQVTREAELTDQNIDPTGQAIDRMYAGTKKQLMKTHATPARKVPRFGFGASSSSSKAHRFRLS